MLSISEIIASFASLLGSNVCSRGRVASVRKMKRSVFVDLFFKNARIQCRFEPKSDFQPHSGDLIEVSGRCVYTKTGEPTIDVLKASFIAKWNGEVDYKKVSEGRSWPLYAFLPETYERIHFSQAVRNFIRQFLTSRGYFEVQTPIAGKNYNGGRSFPVTISYLGNKLGFCRTTMEDRMQALIAIGYDKIFQIGSIFRSEQEHTFLEGYEVFATWENGKEIIKEMLAWVVQKLVFEGIGGLTEVAEHVVRKNWLEVDFFESSCQVFKTDFEAISGANSQIIESLVHAGVINRDDLSLETIADEMANAVAERMGVPTIINGFPVWSSPLYAPFGDSSSPRIQRSRMYLPGQKGGFEIGVQENCYERFVARLEQQRERWNLPESDDRIMVSDLEKVISGGLPPMFGFGLNPDRIVKLWRQDCNIDPYQE